MRKISLSASGADRWTKCFGSPHLIAQLPRVEQSKWAEEGTQAHQLASDCITSGLDPIKLIGKKRSLYNLDGNKESDYKVTKDMAEAVKVYVDYIVENIEGLATCNWQVEQRVELPLIPGQKSFLDCVIKRPFDKLHIVDYKHGAGVSVDAEDNLQMIYYALCVAMQEGEGAYELVEMTIVQPRSFDDVQSVKTWIIPYSELFTYWIPYFKQAIKSVEELKDQFTQGEHCKWCPAMASCPAMKKEIVPMIDNKPSVELLTGEQAVKVVINKKLINDFVKACEERIEREVLRENKTYEGIKIVKKRSYKKWSDETMAASTLLSKYTTEQVFNQSLKTPTQIIKDLGEDAAKDLLADGLDEFTIAPSADRRKGMGEEL